jgi:hypothetical protein
MAIAHKAKQARMAQNPYADIAREFKPKYNVDLRTGKRGRPTEDIQKARKFSWAGRYTKPIVKKKPTPQETALKVIRYLANKPLTGLSHLQVYIRGKAKFIESYIRSNMPVPSSWIDELEWHIDGRVHVSMNGSWYTYFKVKESVFLRWQAGLASCITDDPQGNKIHRKRWVKDKTPSLGAFYNKYIKGRYECSKGKH